MDKKNPGNCNQIQRLLDGYSQVVFTFLERQHYPYMRKHTVLVDKKRTNKQKMNNT